MNERTLECHLRIDIKAILRCYQHAKLKQQTCDYVEFKLGDRMVAVAIMNEQKTECDVNGQIIKVANTPCHYGNRRYWFICPECERRCASVYFSGDVWACRKCLNLVYSSQQVTKNDFMAYYEQANQVARIIDSDYSMTGNDFIKSSALMLFPDKPKYMKWAKYSRLVNEFETYRHMGNNQLIASMKAIVDRVTSDQIKILK